MYIGTLYFFVTIVQDQESKMKTLKQAFAAFLAIALLVCAMPVAVMAAEGDGVVTVGAAAGYPGDIVAVTVSITELPKNDFSYGSFVVSYGENLQYVNVVGCGGEYRMDSFRRPDDVADIEFKVTYNNSTVGNYKNEADLFVVYFKIKSSAVASDNNTAKNKIHVSTEGDAFNFYGDAVDFSCVDGYVEVKDRNSALGEALVGHSITLDGSVSMNFHVNVPKSVLNAADAAVIFTVDGNEKIEAEKKLSDCRKDANGNVMLSFELPSPMWTRTVTAQIVSGGEEGEIYSYSVKNYALYILSGAYSTDNADSDAKLKALCVALLNYGSYSQEYFGYFTNDLANKDVNYGETLAIDNLVSRNVDELITDNCAAVNGSATGVAYAGVNVAVDSATAIRHFFNIENTDGIEFYAYRQGETPVKVNASVVDNMIAVTVKDIPAAYLDSPYVVKIVNTADSTELTVTYSVRSYMASAVKTGAKEMQNLMRAMYLYNVAANEYFGK